VKLAWNASMIQVTSPDLRHRFFAEIHHPRRTVALCEAKEIDECRLRTEYLAMTPEDQSTFVKIVAQVLIADGVLGDNERKHLDQVMSELEMSKEEQKAALKGIDLDSPVEERIATLSDETRSQLMAAVERAAATDETEEQENILVDRIRTLLAPA
jgi:hypothetical protein